MTRRRARRERRAMALLGLAGVVAASAVAGVAGEMTNFPDTVAYNCESNKCVFTSDSSATYQDALTCMQACGDSNLQSVDEGSALSDIPDMTVQSSLNGTCTNCSFVIDTTWNFPRMLDSLDLTAASLVADGCNFTCEAVVSMPALWVLTGDASTCYAGTSNNTVECSRNGNATIIPMDASALSVLMQTEDSYSFIVDHVTTRLGPGTFSEETTFSMKFDGTGCRATTNSTSDSRQVFDLELTSDSYQLIGAFSNTVMTATSANILSSTDVTMSFDSGAVLSAGAFILLRVATDLESRFSEMITNVSEASMVVDSDGDGVFETVDMELYVGEANISFTIPDTFTSSIQNGDTINITFSSLQNPANTSVAIEKLYLSAYQGLAPAVDNSPIFFYDLLDANRTLKAAGLDIATVVVFGACFLVSLVIIRWHGLPLTATTIWTDLVAIAALFSFAAGCGGFLVWVIQPSKAYVYWYSAQFFFNTAMILALCFHWATVLSFKWFKKLSLKSPATIAFVAINLGVLAVIIVFLVTIESKLTCVYDNESLECSSATECAASVAAEGAIVRGAVQGCEMQNFYLTFGGGLILYTVMLMVLGCMVMSRGRTLMLNEDPSDARIRKSLTIFYAIIATTCVLYISAQVINIAQYASAEDSTNSLSDAVWYIFIVWLPHSVPPMLLLFLQWNPSTENYGPEETVSIDNSSKEDVFNYTPRSSGSSSHMPYSKIMRDRISMGDSLLHNDEPGTRLRLIVRLKLPASFDRACFVSLDFYSSKDAIASNESLSSLSNLAVWKCVGTTEPVGVTGETESVVTSGSTHAIFPFVAVLEVPMIGPASNTLLRFMVHASTLGKRDTSSHYLDSRSSSGRDTSTGAPLSFQMTMFHPCLEFVTSAQAVLDAAASGHSLNIYASDDHTCAILEEFPSLQSEVNSMLMGNAKNAELSVQTVMMPGEATKDDQTSHKNIGNIIRFFQYDTEDGTGGLVVEDLQESVYTNAIPRQLIELIAVERQEQVERAREDLHSYLNQKKDKQNRGFYGTLIGQIQDDTDSALAREWLEERVRKRKEYVAMLRRNIQYLVNRDKHKNYFKASVEKKSDDLRFVPINLHIQDLLIGPTNAFINDEKRRSSKEVSAYDFTTVGAPSAHCYKFTKGGILSFQNRRKKMEAKIAETDLDLSKWPEEVREYDDLKWDLQLRMDCSFAQALASLTCSFVRKVEVALQNPDVVKGEDMLRQFSSLGFLFQVESLLSTHGKEIGMIEDMAGAVEHLSCVAFVIQDVRDKPSNRFSFRMSRRKDVADEAGVVKVAMYSKTGRDAKRSQIKYIVKIQVTTSEVELPERLASGGEIHVTPMLFTQGINEMQTIANNTERAKTELQDIINLRSLKPLKSYCDKYRRLLVAMSSGSGGMSHGRGPLRYKSSSQPSPTHHLTADQITQELRQLEASINDAAQSLVKTKRTDILKRSSDLCRELGGGRVTVCKSAKDRTAMSVTLEQVRILQRHHDLPAHRVPATVSVMRSHGVRIENALKNTGKRMFAFNKLQRSLLPEEYRCPDQVGGTGNVS